MRVGYVSILLVAPLLSGCASNDQVYVGISNETDFQQTVDVTVTWIADGAQPATWLERTVVVAPGDHARAGAFLRPCEKDLVGTLRFQATAGNGTQVVWDQAWDAAGCVEQSVALRMETDRMAWTAAYAD